MRKKKNTKKEKTKTGTFGGCVPPGRCEYVIQNGINKSTKPVGWYNVAAFSKTFCSMRLKKPCNGSSMINRTDPFYAPAPHDNDQRLWELSTRRRKKNGHSTSSTSTSPRNGPAASSWRAGTGERLMHYSTENYTKHHTPESNVAPEPSCFYMPQLKSFHPPTHLCRRK